MNTLLFYMLKILTIKEMRETFRELLQEHETKTRGNVYKTRYLQKLVLDLKSGHQALLKWRPDQLCDSLTSVKTGVEELKEIHPKTI